MAFFIVCALINITKKYIHQLVKINNINKILKSKLNIISNINKHHFKVIARLLFTQLLCHIHCVTFKSFY